MNFCITSKSSKRELSVHDTSMAFGDITLVFKPIGGIIGFDDSSNVLAIFCSFIVVTRYANGPKPISLTAAKLSTYSAFCSKNYDTHKIVLKKKYV